MIHPWQEKQWHLMWTSFLQDRIAHAILLQGAPGLGKLSLARHYAQLLLCKQPNQETQAACDQCKSCQLWHATSHPDFFMVTLEEKSRVIKVDQIRDLVGRVSQTASRQGRQVVLLSPADAMHDSAVNALLKTLEEPSGSVVFILVANQTQRCPATLLSRCQQVSFSSDVSVASWLRSSVEDEAKADLFLRAAFGAPLVALDLSTSDFLSVRHEVMGHLEGLIESTMDVVTIAERIVKTDVALWIQVWLCLIYDLIKIKSGVNGSEIIYQDSVNQYQQWCRSVLLTDLYDYLSDLMEVKQWLDSGHHCNVPLLVERVLLGWVDCVRSRSRVSH